MAAQRAFLIDGTAFCYRAFYAIRGLSTSDGRPTNAVYGFARMLQSLQEKQCPQYLAVAFDVGKPTFRHKRFEAYKIQRKPMPDTLISQIPVVKSLLQAYRVPLFEREGYEAEDVLATIALQIAGGGVEVFLVTGDKDALQLVNSHIKVYNPHKEDQILDAEAVRSRYGVGPERMVDFMALMGDDIDNIPGVPGIGEKTATQLLKQFGSLEALYQHLEDLDSPARRASLSAAREQVELSRELARIDREVPMTVTLEALRVQEPDWRALRTLFRELEFKRLLHALDAAGPAGAAAGRAPVRVTPCVTAQELDRCLEAVAGQPSVGIGCWPVDDALLLGVAVSPDAAWIGPLDAVRLAAPSGKRLAAWLADPSAKKIGHDLKTAMRLLNRLALPLRGVAGDTMLAAYLVNPARTAQTLSDVSDESLGAPLPPLPSDGRIDAALARLEPFGQHLCAVLPLHERLASRLQEAGLDGLYRELELPLLDVLARMEAAGIAVDLPYLAGLRATMDTRLNQLAEEIYRLAGSTFNLNSPKQLGQVLFDQLGLPVIKRGKTGPSTDSDVLQHLAPRHPLPQQLLQYRELSKLVSTYVEALPKLADPSTGRLHTSFNQTATATGRLSSSEPNLQNIPIKTELGRSIRKAFIPGIPDGVLVAADYSQVELRILAHCSGDARLSEAFREGRDIHRFTASLIYGCPESEVQPEQRNAMKAVNFGIIYGMSSHGLSKELGMSFEEAQAFIDAYFERYPGVRQYLDAQIEHARREGYVQTLLGRRRYIPEVHSPDGVIRQLGERMAINAPIQGTAADLIKRAMVQLASAMDQRRLKSRMVLQVHDELVVEAPRSELKALVPLVRRVMEGAIALNVPLVVTIKAGPNWLDMQSVE
ncbi:MAG: DNA polymerase I [Candidatus Omnitrophica bacterium]|nr:DNA polymerase I [Candidatus Omnitrophota bacterium]